MLLKAGAQLEAVNNAKQKPIDVAKLNKEVGAVLGCAGLGWWCWCSATSRYTYSTAMLAGWHA